MKAPYSVRAPPRPPLPAGAAATDLPARNAGTGKSRALVATSAA
jgi:hypothetical protein